MATFAQTRDGRLVERIRAGDARAFEQVYARYQPSILAFCRHLTGQLEDAEDAVQHTFLAAYGLIAESEGRLELRPWLFTVARNRCLSLLRMRRDHGTVVLHDAEDVVYGLGAEVERREELRDLVVDLARLPERQRAALLLSQIDAMSHSEIGMVLGVASDKVKALVFQARATLASSREARDAPCVDIRRQITTSRGSALRRRTLRHHVRACAGCREFEAVVLRQRRDLGLLLPVLTGGGLREALAGALGRDGASAAGAGGTAASAGTGGAASGGLAGTLTAIGTQGVAKLAIVGVVASGGAAGAVAADLPAQIHGDPPAKRATGPGVERQPATAPGPTLRASAPSAERHARLVAPTEGARGRRRAGDEDDGPRTEAAGGRVLDEAPGRGQPPTGGGGGGSSGLPPGLAKKDELPPGLAKNDELPPGLAKRGGSSPQAKKPKPPKGNGKPAKGNGSGGSGAPEVAAGGVNGDGGGSSAGGNADPGAGAGGTGNGNANGHGNGNGNGSGGGNGNGNGNGGGNPN